MILATVLELAGEMEQAIGGYLEGQREGERLSHD